jgi:hypothetical protein
MTTQKAERKIRATRITVKWSNNSKHGIQQLIQKIKEKKYRFVIAKDCYSMRLDLLTNATVVDDAIRFVSSNKFKDNLKSSSDNDEIRKEKSEELDYDEDKVQLDEDKK